MMSFSPSNNAIFVPKWCHFCSWMMPFLFPNDAVFVHKWCCFCSQMMKFLFPNDEVFVQTWCCFCSQVTLFFPKWRCFCSKMMLFLLPKDVFPFQSDVVFVWPIQVKELGAVVYNCSCLAQDMAKVFEVYWYLGEDSATIPRQWPPELKTIYSNYRPMNLRLNNTKAEVYISVSLPRNQTEINKVTEIFHKTQIGITSLLYSTEAINRNFSPEHCAGLLIFTTLWSKRNWKSYIFSG